MDGAEAAARIAHMLSEVVAIYPITPASPMAELCDTWSAAGRANLWGAVPEVVQMQSEAGAAGAVHGALVRGALATTFTASQGLLLMIPNMYKIAGELLPGVIHVAARAVATHALSIFGDHSDVMACRQTGFAMLASGSVQEAQDLALVAHAAALRGRVPFVHFFDGFRTSHEMNTIDLLAEEDVRALVDEQDVLAHRARGLSPDHPVLRGSAQNPDVFFQSREAANPFHDAVPGIVAGLMARLGERTGRRYGLVEYEGHPEADRVLVLMGSAQGAAGEAVQALGDRGERVGVLRVRLYRPFPADALVAALPPGVRTVVVLDRTKEPGAPGEPLLLEVTSALADRAMWAGEPMPRIVGGRYGLGSKELTPAMVAAALAEASRPAPRRRFTLGIRDDVTGLSLDPDPAFRTTEDGVRAVLYGLGSDGTVGSAKSTVHIVADETPLHAQGYFVYDSKKSGSITASHLRFSERPIRSTYLVERAGLVSVNQFSLVERIDVLEHAGDGATVILNSPHGPEGTWNALPAEVQEQVIARGLRVYAIDADRVAADAGMGRRINTVMQPCLFALAGILPGDRAIEAIKRSIERTFAKRGHAVVERNFAAVDRALAALHEVPVPTHATSHRRRRPPVPEAAPDFVQRVTGMMLAGRGDLLPVSALPADGAFPTATARWEKRGIARDIPIWDPEICIDCGRCTVFCPHAAIRMKVYEPEALEGAPEGFPSKPFRSKELPGRRMTIQVAPDDCTGCGVCVEMCPAHAREEVRHRAINMERAAYHAEAERARLDVFLALPQADPTAMAPDSVKGSQVREPLFEFSGACAGCGETPYLKLLTQLFGDRMVVANATGCSSIYGGNLPTTPWAVNADGRGPAWANSLFEDNAEFGLGMRIAIDHAAGQARALLERLAPLVGEDLAGEILTARGRDDAAVAAQRVRVARLKEKLEGMREFCTGSCEELLSLADDLVPRSVWIVGGDGWAYDIGSAGLDHVLAAGRDVNVLVLDTEVYSNTGGQASKASPRGASAKFASSGKGSAKKDLGMIASAYGDVFVAQVAIGADPTHAVKALLEAEAWPGPSLVIAYSTCIAHGFDMVRSMSHQSDAVRSGYWPLWRYHPGVAEHEHPMRLDSKPPSVPVKQFALQEARFAMLARSDPERFEHLLALAQADVDERRRLYEQLAGVERTVPHEDDPGPEAT
ncbi:MAG: pyruvate:ferredoxin (flavodoxin) oxidoreductase [Thermoleophilia bacterium]|jgi:pyruvate-ferredoxin/flavodoxin oxidoreductase|nr:pyruvate:ferredoxin (flavodoxin) oxidoreductase [Thermoleophilia bacterium]